MRAHQTGDGDRANRRRGGCVGGAPLDKIVPLPVVAGILMLIAGAAQLAAALHAFYRRDSLNQASGLQRYRTLFIVSGVSLTLITVAIMLLIVQGGAPH
jgi:hypothetical protein